MTDKAFLDLLDLQAVDTQVDQFLHARAALPELEEYRAANARAEELRRTAAEQDAALAETVLQLNKAEGELELTERKRGSEEMRMFAGGLSAKDLGNLQREVEMLGRQIDAAEESILAQLEVRDRQEAALTETTGELTGIESDVARLEAIITARWKEIDAEVAVLQERRRDFTPLIPAELLELYERLRAAKEGVGVARLLEGVCGGCHLSLSPAEQHEVLKEDPPRCLQCRRILVPQ
jgi:predicted  nucleic acid-binding Zn-ribbon protein